MATEVSARCNLARSNLVYRQRFVGDDTFKRQIWRDGSFAIFRTIDVFLAALYVEWTITLGSIVRFLIEQDTHCQVVLQ